MSILGSLSVVAALAAGPQDALLDKVYLTGPDGRLLRIVCGADVCHVERRARSGAWRMVEATPCGQRNFDVLEFKYRAAGYR